MTLITKHSTLATVISATVIVAVLLINVYLYVFATPATQTASDVGYIRTDGTIVPAADRIAPPYEIPWLAATILLVSIAAIVIGLIFFNNNQKKQQFNRDEQRKTDLINLSQAFGAYFTKNGHYPLSQKYSPEYYTGVNFAHDWQYYGFPDQTEMKQYLPNWPIFDPSNKSGDATTNTYIYYPHQNGTSFSLYAHLEQPSSETPNYNQQDNLPEAWGQYNYKVDSQATPAPEAKS